MAEPLPRLVAALAERYRLERELGQGGMATVYLAADLKHDRQVAIKVLKPELAAVLGAERFVQEIKTTAALQHPHILPLFDSGSADGFLYYVMPYVEGETLRSKLDREKQLGVDEAVKVTTEVADALDYAHRHGVIHRDIKPENILLHDGRPMVADFGIALAVSAAAGGRMTETGLSLGTPHYMSPEQATAEKEITARSDVYSLASVLYEMLAGQPPHLGGSAQQIIMKIIAEPVPVVTSLRKSVPPNVAAALAQALEKVPADRFESAKAFAEALRNPGFTVAGTMLMEGPAAARRRSRANYALAGVTLAALAIAAWGWMRPAAKAAMQDSWRVPLQLPDSVGISEYAWPSLSSDGTTLAIVLADHQVWLFRADGTAPAPVAGSNGSYAVSIAPDGKRLALVGNGKIQVVPIAGGTPTTISDSSQFIDPPGWFDDHTLVFANLSGLMKVSTSGGPLTHLAAAPDGGALLHAAPLPGGRGVVFSVQPGDFLDASQSRIAVVGPDGGKVTDLMPGLWAAYAEPGHLIVTQANGSIVAVPFDLRSLRTTEEAVPIVTGLPKFGLNSSSGGFAVAPTGRIFYLTGEAFNRTDLVRVRRDGTTQSIDTSRSGDFGNVAVSPDGRWAAASVTTDRVDELRLRDLTSGARVRIAVPGVWLRDPVILRDSRTLTFLGIGLKRSGLYRASVDGTIAPDSIFTTNQDSWPMWPATSTDGDAIIYTLRSPGHLALFAHSLAHPETPDQALSDEKHREWEGVPSPDGRWLAYLSDESGRTELMVRPAELARAERWQVPRTTSGAPDSPRWSRDSRELVYRSGSEIVAARVAPGAAFAITGQHVLFSAADYVPAFDIFPNGDLLMVRQRPASEASQQLMMIDRWQSGLKARD
jgi:eukaryotic-like serine/threonine-protein kinase